MKKIALLCSILSLGLSGCGGPEGALNTSYVTSTVSPTVVKSDVATWVDATTLTASASCSPSIATTTPDSVNVTVTSTAFANSGTLSSPLRIEAATINYAPATSLTPALASLFQTLNVTIANGGSVTLPIELVSSTQKQIMQSSLGCTGGAEYIYYANIVIEVLETATNKKTLVTSSVQLYLSDYIDK